MTYPRRPSVRGRIHLGQAEGLAPQELNSVINIIEEQAEVSGETERPSNRSYEKANSRRKVPARDAEVMTTYTTDKIMALSCYSCTIPLHLVRLAEHSVATFEPIARPLAAALQLALLSINVDLPVVLVVLAGHRHFRSRSSEPRPAAAAGDAAASADFSMPLVYGSNCGSRRVTAVAVDHSSGGRGRCR